MPVRSARFGTVTILSCSALVPLGNDARGAEPTQPSAVTSLAAKVSAFEPGLWEYRRTVVTNDSARPQFATLKKCADPSNEIPSKMALLKSRDCRFTPVVYRQGGYVSSWICPTPNGPVSFRHVLVVRDATSYLSMSESRLGQRVTQQKLEARRVGECSAQK